MEKELPMRVSGGMGENYSPSNVRQPAARLLDQASFGLQTTVLRLPVGSSVIIECGDNPALPPRTKPVVSVAGGTEVVAARERLRQLHKIR